MSEIFHISERGDIQTFTPRPFWHVNFVWSGRVSPNKSIPNGATIFTVVYCDSADKLPFYYLPRSTPRIWLTHAISGRNIRTLQGLCDTSGDYRVLVVPTDAEAGIRSQQFYRYSFDPSEFELLPTGEWVCYRPVKPTAVSGAHRTTESLAIDGVQLVFCSDLPALKHRLDEESVVHHCEKV